ncbi:hypothetical protein ACF09H_03455 [Streptomyces sp. NPDC014983]|uniref:hypothetical protein n=1 Tax=Streptomyces sp. NPDC014983 TaxID=3364933 RepID=UPI0036FDC628
MAHGAGRASSGSPAPGVRLEYHVPGGRLLTAGDPLWFSIDGMAPGWDRVTVASLALEKPVFLVPVRKGARQSTELDEIAAPLVRPGLRAGTYPVTATSHGRTVATARLRVAAADAAEISRFVIGPTNRLPGGDTPAPVRPGSDVRLVLVDLRPASEDSLTVRSPIFAGPVTIRTGSADDPGCKCDDPGTVYAGHARVRGDVPAGRYPLTAVSHHGRQTTERHVTVVGAPAGHGGGHGPAIGAAATAGAVLVAGAVVAVRRRARATASSG